MDLGAALGLLGNFQGARNWLERALRVHKEVLPEGHPLIARNLILFGALLAEEADRDGQLPSAEKREILSSACGHLDEALALIVRSHGEDHPLTAGVMRAAASVAEAEGRQDDASSWRGRADAIRDVALRGEDADFLATGAEVFTARGLYDEAELYQRQSLELRRSAAEEENLEVAAAEFALGCLLQLRGRDREAAAHLERALLLREQLLGGDHPATELARDSLSYLRERGR